MALGLDEQGALDLAIAMGLLDPLAYNYRKQLDLLKKQLDANLITNDQYVASVAALNNNINNIPKNTTVYIDYVLRTVGAPPVPAGAPTIETNTRELHYNGETDGAPTGYQWWKRNGKWVTEKIPGMALGGDVVAGHTYWVGEKGPEPFIPETNGLILSTSTITSLMNALKSLTGGLNTAPNMGMPGAAAWQQTPTMAPVNITVNATVANNMDMYTLARRVATEINLRAR
jgi:hypothetical protein